MFSQVFVCPGGEGGWPASGGGGIGFPAWITGHMTGGSASSGGWADTPPSRNWTSGRYGSYWNVSLFCVSTAFYHPYLTLSMDIVFSHIYSFYASAYQLYLLRTLCNIVCKEFQNWSKVFYTTIYSEWYKYEFKFNSSSRLQGGVCFSACWDTPPSVSLETPPWVLAWRPPQLWTWRPPQVWTWRPSRCGPGDHPPPWKEFLTHASESITLPRLRSGR